MLRSAKQLFQIVGSFPNDVEQCGFRSGVSRARHWERTRCSLTAGEQNPARAQPGLSDGNLSLQAKGLIWSPSPAALTGAHRKKSRRLPRKPL